MTWGNCTIGKIVGAAVRESSFGDNQPSGDAFSEARRRDEQGDHKLNVKTVTYPVGFVTGEYRLLVEKQRCLTKESNNYLVQLLRDTSFHDR